MSSLEQLCEAPKRSFKEKSILKSITDAYFAPKSWERWKNGRMYEWFGVHIYKKFLPTYGDYVTRWLNYHPIASGNRKRNLRRYNYAYRVHETIHAVGLFFGMQSISYALEQGDHKSALFIGALNTLVNIYPIFTQRYNRARIYNILEKYEKRNQLTVPE